MKAGFGCLVPNPVPNLPLASIHAVRRHASQHFPPLSLGIPYVSMVVLDLCLPAFEDGKDQEVRIENVCVAGGAATVSLKR